MVNATVKVLVLLMVMAVVMAQEALHPVVRVLRIV